MLKGSSFRGLIKFNNVSFSYVDNEQVLNNISFKINPGSSTDFASMSYPTVGKSSPTQKLKLVLKLSASI